MQAPLEIIDSLESILSILFYDIKQKERSIFILVDNLVEVSCKARLRERNKQFSRGLDLEEILKISSIGGELKKRFLSRRKERNLMQHDLVSVTVTNAHCADSIVDLCKLIKRLWGKYSFDGISEWLLCALRIVKLYSRSGDEKKRKMFEHLLERIIKWNEIEVTEVDKLKSSLEEFSRRQGVDLDDLGELPAGKRLPKDQEIIIQVGTRKYWTILIQSYTVKINTCLDDLEIENI